MAKCTNENLNKAREAKDDEFYTLRRDIEYEITKYADQLKGKVVYSNCDHADSEFTKFFTDNKDRMGLKDFWHYGGDFESEESVNMLKGADVVITNPPFSLFRKYMAQLLHHKKEFIIIGNITASVTKQIFPLIKDGVIKWGYQPHGMNFLRPDGSIEHVAACWYTNLDVSKPPMRLIMPLLGVETFSIYDGRPDVIEVGRTSNIPSGYGGKIAVPVSFLDRHDGKQFRILECLRGSINGDLVFTRLVIQRNET